MESRDEARFGSFPDLLSRSLFLYIFRVNNEGVDNKVDSVDYRLQLFL